MSDETGDETGAAAERGDDADETTPGESTDELASTPTRRAVVTTTHADAAVVAASLAPDNTESMTTTVRGSTVETAVARDRTGGLQSSVDDYVVNLTVADAVFEAARDTNPNHE